MSNGDVQQIWEMMAEEAVHGISWSAKVLGVTAEMLEIRYRREAKEMERIVRDAIVGYLDMYPRVPNDEAGQELKERAEKANGWLRSHGFEPEPLTWSKEEAPCL